MENTFEYLADLIPDLKRIEKIPINDLTCNRLGFNTNFYNYHFLLKLQIESILSKKDYIKYSNIILNHFMSIANAEFNCFTPNDNTLFESILEEHNRTILLIKNKITNNG